MDKGFEAAAARDARQNRASDAILAAGISARRLAPARRASKPADGRNQVPLTAPRDSIIITTKIG